MPDHPEYPRADGDLITVSREPTRHDWDYDGRVEVIPPPDVVNQVVHEDRMGDIDNVCHSQWNHIRWDHRRWEHRSHRYGYSPWIYRTCAQCERGERRRCDYAQCRQCWPRPSLSRGAYHEMYRNRQQRADGISPWAHRGNPCGDARYCRVCYPRWAMTLSELSELNAVERRDRWENWVRDRRYRRIREIQNEAGIKAKALLKELCSEKQWAQYEAEGRIVVTGSDGGVYAIRHGYSGNVEVIRDANGDESSYYRRKCAHPEMSQYMDVEGLGNEYVEMPLEDAMITQLLCIRTNEKRWLEIANNF